MSIGYGRIARNGALAALLASAAAGCTQTLKESPIDPQIARMRAQTDLLNAEAGRAREAAALTNAQTDQSVALIGAQTAQKERLRKVAFALDAVREAGQLTPKLAAEILKAANAAEGVDRQEIIDRINESGVIVFDNVRDVGGIYMTIESLVTDLRQDNGQPDYVAHGTLFRIAHGKPVGIESVDSLPADVRRNLVESIYRAQEREPYFGSQTESIGQQHGSLDVLRQRENKVACDAVMEAVFGSGPLSQNGVNQEGFSRILNDCPNVGPQSSVIELFDRPYEVTANEGRFDFTPV
ncbi:MAG: hypothetical protein ACPGRX_00950 [Bdellovibrionales bacterium]